MIAGVNADDGRQWRVVRVAGAFIVSCSHHGDPWEPSCERQSITEALAYIGGQLEGDLFEERHYQQVRSVVRSLVQTLDAWVAGVADVDLAGVSGEELSIRVRDLADTLALDQVEVY